MWADILVSLGIAIAEYGFCTVMDDKKRKNLQKKLNNTINTSFKEYENSSIDSGDFYYLINSHKFKDILHNYFYTLKDGSGTKEYRKTVIDYICNRCSKAERSDVSSFFDKVEVLYINYLSKIIEKDPELNALFQLLTISHRSIISKLSEGMEDVIKYIQSSENNRISISDERIKEFHRICENEYGIIRFTGISGAERRADQDINTFYIPNTYSFYNVLSSGIYNNTTIGIDSIGLKDLFNFGNKVVVVGGAGLGKTTSLNYLYCKYEELYNEYPLKIKIDLRDYAEDITINKKAIISCIAEQFLKKTKRTSKANLTETEMILSEYLENGRCLVIFDALDEIPTQDARNSVRTEIANFCELYFLNRYIISTREVGYLKNKFDNSFVHLKIDKFSREQIRDYSKNWFKVYHTNPKFSDFDAFWEVFSRDVEKANCHNLIVNPIILILALVILDTNQSLPSRKVDFYEKCVNTFLSEREIQRGLLDISPKAQNILGTEMVIPRIANYKYFKTNENISYKFTNSELKNSVFEAIEVSDKINWVKAVDEYIRYLIERTELIGEIDDDILDFAHKTFYEYFLAIYFSKQLEINILQRQLLKWIGDANNHELSKLIIEIIIQKGDPYKQAEIINYLFNAVKSQKPPKKHDVFYLLVDLYDENILPPKYYNIYYQTILRNGPILKDFLSRRRRLRDPLFGQFDAHELANVYCETVLTDEEFLDTIDAVYHLNNDFRDNVLKIFTDKTLLQNTITLFSFANSLDSPNKPKRRDNELLYSVKYFLEEKNEYLNRSPLLYSSLVRILTQYKLLDEFYIKKIIFNNIPHNDYFFRYSRPSELIALIDYAKESSELFSLLLLVMVVCSKNGTNMMIGYVLKHCDTDHKNRDEIVQFTYWIWKSLNCSTDYQAYKEEISKKGLFEDKYISIYERVYEIYHFSEIDAADSRINEFNDNLSKLKD